MPSAGIGAVRLCSVRAGLAIVTALVVAGCGGSTTSAGPTGTPPSTAPAASTTTAPGEPIVYGPTTFVSGQEACTFTDTVHATWTTAPDGTVRVRNGWFTCVVTSDDPRVAGSGRYTWNADRWGQENHGAMTQWGITRIRNSGGTWVGRYQGIYTSGTGDVVFSLLTGTGDYAGLSYYRWENKTFGTTWPTEGLIFPGTMQSD
jgi:hypothetical protein